MHACSIRQKKYPSLIISISEYINCRASVRIKSAKGRVKEAASDARPIPVDSATPDAVLTAMGEEGRLCALWEYYNVWCDT